MPWKDLSVVEQRFQFVAKYLSGEHTMTELCEEFGISRRTGYKFIRRFEEKGVTGVGSGSSGRFPEGGISPLRNQVGSRLRTQAVGEALRQEGGEHGGSAPHVEDPERPVGFPTALELRKEHVGRMGVHV